MKLGAIIVTMMLVLIMFTTFFKKMLPPGVNKLLFVHYNNEMNPRVIQRSIAVQNTPTFTYQETLNPHDFSAK